MHVVPYLSFDGTCEQALRFYAECLRGQVVMMVPYRGSPAEAHMPPEALDRVMHGRVQAGGVILMGSDGPPGMVEPMQGVSVSLMLDSVEEADRIFAALAEGGAVRMPIAETFWADRFGMVTDRFGTPWMLNVEKPMPPSP